MKALIIEPSRTCRLFVSMTLKSQGVLTDCVGTMGEAKALLRCTEYQMICIARILKSGDCGAFCYEIRAQAATRTLPIIMLTCEEIDNVHAYLALGVTEVIKRHDVTALGVFVEDFRRKSYLGSHNSGSILYVEDSPSIAKSTSNLLEDGGFKVSHFSSGEKALESYQCNSFDLIITDVTLPGKITGPGLIHQIRESECSNEFPIPILAISSCEDIARTLALFRAGVNDCISKPIINEELLARVNNLILNRCLFKKLAEQQCHLEQLAMTDQLTGLYNRHYLMDAAQQKISSAKRHKSNLSLIMIDVDHFKAINDEHGHPAGDQILSKIGEIFNRFSRGEDIAARVGGEEFVIVLEHCPLDAAKRKAEYLRGKLEQLSVPGLKVTASFGVVEYTEADSDFDDLLVRADKAVYVAKDEGRNCISWA